MDWKKEVRTCLCGSRFGPKREMQRHCSTKCRVKRAMETYRRSDNGSPTLTQIPRSDNTGVSDAPTALSDGPTMVWPVRSDDPWPTPGALQGDDYPLEYSEDGYPKLPACLDRRWKPKLLEEAA